MTRGVASSLPAGAPTVRELLADGKHSYSFEFFPPKDDAGEAQLWQTIRRLEALQPTFVSVTYGAGGSTRDRTLAITERLASETTLTPVGHLTCVGQTRAELRQVIGRYAAAGVRNVLALRGDPEGGPGQQWASSPGGLAHGLELVELVRELGDFCVGVAAFPEGHPEAPDLDTDARILVAKAAAGADFAVTQLFFRAEDYFALVDRIRALGCDLPVLPGILPVTNLAQVERFARLAGARMPATLLDQLTSAGSAVAVRRTGVGLATDLCHELLAGGAPGLHFYTLNHSTATLDIFAGLGQLG